ncbi:hypothetical protein C8R46DRAFT_904749 [Mycena filopes]|nr:hypothetical protein C8R46DRAFT_904749 [Mycena filopes]
MGDRVFQRGAASGSFVCALCLGSHENVAGCRSTTTWDGRPTRCHRNAKGKIANPQGIELCLDFQLPRGCNGNRGRHNHVHECSGCGATDHGASSCAFRARL